MARPASSSRLFLRNKIFYFRFRLKKPFPELLGKAEIRISTGTPYHSVAKRFSDAMGLFMQDLLSRLANGEAITNLTNADIMRMARVYYAGQIEILNVLSLYQQYDENRILEISREKEMIQNMLRTNAYKVIGSDVDSFIDEQQLNIEKDSYDYLKICNMIAKAKLDL